MTYLFALMALVMLLSSCTGSAILRTTVIDGHEEVPGTVSLVLYGGGHPDELEVLAILDVEGDSYEIVPYAPAFTFKVKKGLSSKEAYKIAEKFISYHIEFWTSRISRISDEQGKIIGYELRPEYLMASDPLKVVYLHEPEGKVKVKVYLDNLFRDGFYDGDD